MTLTFGSAIIAGRGLTSGIDLAKDWPWLVAGLGWIVAAVAGVVLLVRIVRLQPVRLRKRCTLQIDNGGNVRDRYELRAEEPSGELRFEFRRGRDLLPVRQVNRMIPVAVATPVAAAAGSAVPTAAAAPTAAQQPAAPSAAAATAAKSAEQARGAAGGIAGILDTLGQLIPGSVGESLKRTAYNLNIKQGQAGRLTVQPKRQLDRVKNLRGQARSVAPMGAVRTAPHAAAATAAEVPPGAAEGARPDVRTVVETWAQTPWVEPGAAVDLALYVAPLQRPTQERTYAVNLFSRSAEQPDTAPNTSVNQVLVRRFSWFRYHGPALALGLLLTAVLAGSFYFLWIARLSTLLGLS